MCVAECELLVGSGRRAPYGCLTPIGGGVAAASPNPSLTHAVPQARRSLSLSLPSRPALPPPPKAVLAATQRSLSAIKRRVGSHVSTGIFFLERPFFDVNVELKARGRGRPFLRLSNSFRGLWGLIGWSLRSRRARERSEHVCARVCLRACACVRGDTLPGEPLLRRQRRAQGEPYWRAVNPSSPFDPGS